VFSLDCSRQDAKGKRKLAAAQGRTKREGLGLRGSGLVWKGIRGGAGAARDEHAGLVLVRRRWGATSLLSSKKVRCSKVAGRGLSFFFSFSDFASSFLFFLNSFGDKKGR
jgi:hypothetical protein